MSDEAQQAGVPETQPSSGTTQTVPSGGDLTPESPPAGEWWESTEGRKQQQDLVWRNGRRNGKELGASEARMEILSRFGVDSLEDLEQKLKPPEKPKEEPVPQGDEDVRDKIIRDLKTQLEDLKKQAQKHQDLAQKHQASLQRSLKSELAARFASMGALDKALPDLVSLSIPHVRWTPEGEIEVVEQDETGARVPARQSLDEFAKDIREQKSWFFRDSGVQGSGVQQRQPVVPVPSGRVQPGSLAERLDEYRRRPRR